MLGWTGGNYRTNTLKKPIGKSEYLTERVDCISNALVVLTERSVLDYENIFNSGYTLEPITLENVD